MRQNPFRSAHPACRYRDRAHDQEGPTRQNQKPSFVLSRSGLLAVLRGLMALLPQNQKFAATLVRFLSLLRSQRTHCPGCFQIGPVMSPQVSWRAQRTTFQEGLFLVTLDHQNTVAT